MVQRRASRASLAWRFAGDRRDDVSGMRMVRVAPRPRVQQGNELCAHRAKPTHTRLPGNRPKVCFRGFLRQTGEVVPQNAVNIFLGTGNTPYSRFSPYLEKVLELISAMNIMFPVH